MLPLKILSQFQVCPVCVCVCVCANLLGTTCGCVNKRTTKRVSPHGFIDSSNEHRPTCQTCFKMRTPVTSTAAEPSRTVDKRSEHWSPQSVCVCEALKRTAGVWLPLILSPHTIISWLSIIHSTRPLLTEQVGLLITSQHSTLQKSSAKTSKSPKKY